MFRLKTPQKLAGKSRSNDSISFKTHLGQGDDARPTAAWIFSLNPQIVEEEKSRFGSNFLQQPNSGKNYNVPALKTPQRKKSFRSEFSSKPNSEKVMSRLQTQQKLRRKSRFGFKFPLSDQNPPIRSRSPANS